MRDELLEPGQGPDDDVVGRGHAPPAATGRVRRPGRAQGAPRDRARGRPPAGPGAPTTCCSRARRASGKTTLAGIVATELDVAPAGHVGPRRRAGRRPRRHPHPTSTRATCCSSTRSTGCPGRSKRCCTRRWRTSSSTSCWARGPRPGRSGSTCPASRWSAPPRAPGSSPARCATASAWSPGSTTTRRPTSRRSSSGPPASSACDIDADGAAEIARRARGTPRIANRLLRRVRDFAEVRGDGVVDRGRRGAGASPLFGVDELGLDKVDRAILSALCERFGGGPVGLSTLAISVGEQTETVEDVYEPFLIQQGLLMRTPRGRVALPAAWAHLGLAAPPASGPPTGPPLAAVAARSSPSPTSGCRRERRPSGAVGEPAPIGSTGRGPRRVRLRPARGRDRPARRSSPATRPGCWSTRRWPAAPSTTARSPTCPDLLRPGDLLVVNDTRVLPARLRAAQADRRRGRGAAARARRRPAGGRRSSGPAAGCRPGTVLVAGDDLDGRGRRAGLGDGTPPGHARPAATTSWPPSPGTARCRCRPTSRAPLADPERYQTVYARRPGSVAAPTAGLHLTDGGARPVPGGRGVGGRHVELVVGLGTFRPITADRVEDHAMHAERYRGARPRRWPRARTRRRGWSRSAPPRVRALESAAATGRARRAAPTCSSAGASTFAGRRRAAHQLPPAPLVAARPGRRVRRAPLARPLRRRRWPRATASSPSATPCSLARRPR